MALPPPVAVAPAVWAPPALEACLEVVEALDPLNVALHGRDGLEVSFAMPQYVSCGGSCTRFSMLTYAVHPSG